MKPQLTWLISLPHAVKLMKKMRQKRHRDAGYYFELTEIGDIRKVLDKPEKSFYGDYSAGTLIFQLNIFYESPNEKCKAVHGDVATSGISNSESDVSV